MFKSIKRTLGLAIVMIATVAALAVPTVHAQSTEALCLGAGGTWTADKGDSSQGTCTTQGQKRTLAGTLRDGAEILSFLVGVASVIMIIIGGLRYVLSNGDANAAQGGKNTILYAVIGLIVASMAYAITRFVLQNIK